MADVREDYGDDTAAGCPGDCAGRCRCDDGWDEPDDDEFLGACMNCGLPDLHNGCGDGIGSCDCPRCQWCGSGPGCDCDPWGEEDEDDEPDDSDPWPPGVVTVAVDRGLL